MPTTPSAMTPSTNRKSPQWKLEIRRSTVPANASLRCSEVCRRQARYEGTSTVMHLMRIRHEVEACARQHCPEPEKKDDRPPPLK